MTLAPSSQNVLTSITFTDAAAQLALGLLSHERLPRYPELAGMSGDLRTMVTRLISALMAHCPEQHRSTTAPAMTEALRLWAEPLGDDPKSAADCTRNLADITLVLCGHHKRVIGT